MNRQPQITTMTRQNIIDTYWNLGFKQGLKDITVTKISKEASINRSTFYEYFIDIYQLRDIVEDELIFYISHSLRDRLMVDFPKNLTAFSEICSEIIPTFQEKMFLLLGESGDPSFRKKMETAILPNFIELLQIPEETPNIDYLSSFVFSVILGSLTHWHETGCQIPLPQLIAITQKFMATGVLGYTGANPFEDHK